MINKRFTLFALLVLAACHPPADQELDPFGRSFGWFDVLAAEDVRAACAQGEPRLRVVYNGGYDEQVRIYDLVRLPDGSARLEVLVRGVPDFGQVQVDDLMAPWRGRRGEARLRPGRFEALRQALERTGPPPVGARLSSEAVWWVARDCGGYHAWRGREQPQVAAMLLAEDPTGIPLAEPGNVPLRSTERDGDVRFWVTIGADGLVGMPTPAGRVLGRFRGMP